MKILVAFSGGKDSQAALLWAVHESGWKKENIIAVFCDTGWEHEATNSHVIAVCKDLGVKLVILKSKKYNGMVDMSKKKGRFPSVKARFCTEELKIKPMIDFILDNPQNYIIIQGIRAQESETRALMSKECTYFKYYFEPYDDNHKRIARLKRKPIKSAKDILKIRALQLRLAAGKLDLRYMTYRKKEVIQHVESYVADIQRPFFLSSAVEVIEYILSNGQKPNPLYYQGVERVGCYPCIMCKQKEVLAIARNDSKYIDRLEAAEKEVGRTFFGPDFVPKRARLHKDQKSGVKLANTRDVIKYLTEKDGAGGLFLFDDEDDNEPRSCMSAFNICE